MSRPRPHKLQERGGARGISIPEDRLATSIVHCRHGRASHRNADERQFEYIGF